MKKATIVILFFIITGTSYCQFNNPHLMGTHDMELKGGISKYGVISNISLSNYFSQKYYNIYSVEYQKDKIKTADVNKISVWYSIGRSVFNADNFYINIITGAYLGYEFLETNMLKQNLKVFTQGLGASFNIEYFFNKIGISLGFKQNYHIHSKIGTHSYNMSLGIKYIL